MCVCVGGVRWCVCQCEGKGGVRWDPSLKNGDLMLCCLQTFGRKTTRVHMRPPCDTPNVCMVMRRHGRCGSWAHLVSSIVAALDRGGRTAQGASC
jgi:hypothetical protein